MGCAVGVQRRGRMPSLFLFGALLAVLSARFSSGSTDGSGSVLARIRPAAQSHSRTLRRCGGRRPVLSTPANILRLHGGADFDEVPCIGALQDFGPLEQFYSAGDSNEVFRRKLQDLKSQYQVGYRPVKGDGNCFIRGYVFGLLEDLLFKPASEASGFRGVLMAYYFTIIDSKSGLGYSSAAVEDFYNDIVNQVQLIEQGDMTKEMLRDNFNSLTLSNAVIFFCRLVCSCYIQQHPELFAPFVGIDSENPIVVAQELKDYCLREVEPLEREVEQVQIIALSSALQVGVRVVHLDRSGGPLNHHDFPEGQTPVVHLLYRPGHYDLIYE